jgi:hypothetical protein
MSESQMNQYIVELYHSRRFWIDGEGWSTSDESRATRYSRAEAYELAHHVHGQVVELAST